MAVEAATVQRVEPARNCLLVNFRNLRRPVQGLRIIPTVCFKMITWVHEKHLSSIFSLSLDSFLFSLELMNFRWSQKYPNTCKNFDQIYHVRYVKHFNISLTVMRPDYRDYISQIWIIFKNMYGNCGIFNTNIYIYIKLLFNYNKVKLLNLSY